jgi:hypothetical protein
MLARTRLIKVVSVSAIALASGGVAWAGTTIAPASAAHNHRVSVADATDPSTDSSTIDTTTTDASSSTEVTDTSTTIEDTTTTTADSNTTTTMGETTTVPSEGTTVPSACKPGWGYGDKNHCHSGPPGDHHDDERQDAKTHGHEHGHDAGDHHGAEHDGSDSSDTKNSVRADYCDVCSRSLCFTTASLTGCIRP